MFRAPVRAALATATLLLGASDGAATANSTLADCNGSTALYYLSGPLFGLDGNIYRGLWVLGTGSITGGANNTMSVSQVQLFLDCTFAGLPGCTDDGAVIDFVGNITTTCGTGLPSFWTASVSGNSVVFTAESPIVIPANQPRSQGFCSLQLDIRIANSAEARDDATANSVEQIVRYSNAVCDNGLPASASSSGAIQLCRVCDDQSVCTRDSCNNETNQCIFTPAVDCSDGNPCTTESCAPATGECSYGAVTCNDANPCTDDGCDPTSGCTFTPNDAPCDDGNACSLDDHCEGGTCSASEWLGCPATSACEPGRCNPATGACVVPSKPACADGNACTRDICDATRGCMHTQVICNDGNPATRDSCDPRFGCVHRPRSGPTAPGARSQTSPRTVGGIE